MTDALDGLDAARRAGWARAYAAEEAAANMLYSLFLHMYLNSDRRDLADSVHGLTREWLNAADRSPGWVSPPADPPDLTPGQVDARIRIARRFIELDEQVAEQEDSSRDPDTPPW